LLLVAVVMMLAGWGVKRGEYLPLENPLLVYAGYAWLIRTARSRGERGRQDNGKVWPGED